jgi:hypothetical protein
MVTYYRGHTVVITHEVVEVWCPDYQRFPIGDLHDVYVCRGNLDPVAVRGLGATVLPILAITAGWQYLDPAIAILTGALLSVATLIAVAAWFERHPPPWELYVNFRGDEIRLFASGDQRVFGQVRRALVRALEANGW